VIQYPKDYEIIGSRIMLRNKYRSEGIDFEKTFAPVARMNSIRSVGTRSSAQFNNMSLRRYHCLFEQQTGGEHIHGNSRELRRNFG